MATDRNPPMTRRIFVTGILSFIPLTLWSSLAEERFILTPEQSRIFRSWMIRIISAQLRSGPTPRWEQRDCVGLVRFAVAEALQTHDTKWRRSNSLSWSPLPPELILSAKQKQFRHHWHHTDGTDSAYISALELVQENTLYQGKDPNHAQAGDLLFFDQGESQHLMVWMGNFIAYHTGTITATDNGLRSVTFHDLMAWSDTRWHPSQNNPNFAGFYRLNFLSA
ncbi:DUF1175 family protein [Sulfuricurvum sp.]|uniref:DUF1175 family protein n=1 Tax=Sulfuricurvum sp. TaxID=2025608 RepID=UPI0026133AB0|nr:DUF1175 family protein [Sulfuricurvum sp.]